MIKAMIAMSGGVDSSVAAYLMQQSGYSCTGATMNLFDRGKSKCSENGNIAPEKDVCSAVDEARAVADQIGIEFEVYDFKDSFDEHVIRRFICEYLQGSTPNPCIYCNKIIKFGLFMDRAAGSGCDVIATGHYARVELSNGRYLLKKGTDAQKDQSYMLYSLTQDRLSHTVFPIGGITKSEVRAIAREQCFSNAGERESQDICFLPRGDYPGFIEEHTSPEPGMFKDKSGNTLGAHSGIHRYTIGQRRGLGISAPYPLYVCAIDPENRCVTLGSNDDLYSKELIAREVNLIATDSFDSPLRLSAKIRYKQREQNATVWQLDDDSIRVEFDKPQRAVTRGQAVVLYDGDAVVGGGTIC